MNIFFKNCSLLALLFLISQQICAQKEANNWLMGGNSGSIINNGIIHLDFKTMVNGYPDIKYLPLNLGEIQNHTVISNPLGALLFYNYYNQIFNALHQPMSNSQSQYYRRNISLKQPDNPNKFWFFHVRSFTSNQFSGIYYSVIDMDLANGLGDVANEKNIRLYSGLAHSLTAVKHANNQDYWLIASILNSDSILSFRITPTGIDSVPIVSKTGRIFRATQFVNTFRIKISPGINKASFNYDQMSNIIVLCNFNSATGMFSEFIELEMEAPVPLQNNGEFSPDNSKFYAFSTPFQTVLYQFDVSVHDSTLIANSKIALDTTLSFGVNNDARANDLQLGPDGKIYVAQFNYLGVINEPNRSGLACDFENGKFRYPDKKFARFFPNISPSWLGYSIINYSNPCQGTYVNFSISNSFRIDSVRWNFGDLASGPSNISYLLNPQHVFSDTGEFTIKAVLFIADTTDTLTQIIKVSPSPQTNLPSMVNGCMGETLTLSAGLGIDEYLWSTGDTSHTIEVSDSGIVWVTTRLGICSTTDTLIISLLPKPTVYIGPDTAFCGLVDYLIEPNATNAESYLWSTGDTTMNLHVNSKGIYSLTVTDGQSCSDADTVFVDIIDYPYIPNGGDTIICGKVAVILDAQNQGSTYLWSNGATTPTITVITSGVFYVTISNRFCSVDDTINVTFVPEEDCRQSYHSFIPNAFSPNGDGTNDEFGPQGSNIKNYHMVIYNRWGEILYNTAEGKPWQGQYKGSLVTEGVYFYRVTTITEEGNMNYYYGSVSLLR